MYVVWWRLSTLMRVFSSLGPGRGRRAICLPCQIAVPPLVFSAELSRDRGPLAIHSFWPYRYKKAALSPSHHTSAPHFGWERRKIERETARPSVQCNAIRQNRPNSRPDSFGSGLVISKLHTRICSLLPHLSSPQSRLESNLVLGAVE